MIRGAIATCFLKKSKQKTLELMEKEKNEVFFCLMEKED